MSKLIELHDIKKSYDIGDSKTEILHGINLIIQPGELLAIMGASGSGKSTLMNIIGLLDRPTSGEYFLNGEEISGLNDNELSALRNHTIGFVFQSFFLLPRLTAEANVGLTLNYRNTPRKEVKRHCLEMLEKVGMSNRSHHRPSELSGGQQQRVAIARALVGEPKIILADEPTGALDSKTSDDVMALFKQLNKDSDTTTIIVTHDEDVAEQCDRVVHIKDGKLEDGE